MNYLSWIFFIFYIVIMLGFGMYRTRRVKNDEQYLLASRNTGLFALTATLVMTEFNTTTLVAYASLGYTASYWALIMAANFLIGILFYAFAAAKKWKAFNGVSNAHYFTERYGKDIGVIAAIILLVSMIGFSATYVKSLALIFTTIFPHVSLWVSSGMLTLLILAMTLRGGLVAIIRTDVISFIVVLIFFPLLFFYANHAHYGSIALPHLSLAQMQQKLPPHFVFSLFILTIFSYILAPWYGQKVVAARNKTIAFWAVALAAVLVFILYSIGIAAATALRSHGIHLLNPEMALPYLVGHVLPPELEGVAYGVLFTVAATTLSGVWSAMVTIVVGKIELQKTKSIKRSVSLTLLFAFISYFLANSLVDNVLDKIILANIPVVALCFALLAGFYWRKTSRLGVYLSIIVGLLAGTITYLHYGNAGVYTWYWAIYGIPLMFIVGILGTAWSNRYKRKPNLEGVYINANHFSWRN